MNLRNQTGAAQHQRLGAHSSKGTNMMQRGETDLSTTVESDTSPIKQRHAPSNGSGVIKKSMSKLREIDSGSISFYRRERKARAIVARQLGTGSGTKLHIGSGALVINSGWINLDMEELPTVDISLNVLDGLPFASNSVDVVYSEHFIEHLPKEGTKYFLAEAYRVLKRGGVHRILTPDIRVCVDVFLKGNWRDVPWSREYGIETSADYLNNTLRLWGHQYLFDRETLWKFADAAGYVDMTWERLGESRFPDLVGIDTRPNSIILDAVKGG